MVKLDIISDPICPWCYIGKTLLDRALEAEPEHPFEIEWHPFQLNPDMPLEGMDRRAYLEGKFGGKAQAVKVYGQIDEHARSVGLELDLGAIQRTPNTLNTHRLIHWAGIEQRQSMVVSALFRAYFKEGRDIGDSEVLADIADTCGMDAALVQRLLATDEDLEGIREKDASFRKMGVNSVPTFIVAGQHAVPGAQPVDVWRSIITDIKAQLDIPA
ncbi:DsbA family oxidoreductase [Planktotalea arctica]|uniref:DsbA family oxidoreductase n=1 Tax=Planktotalea arctica TaxID=1481893 RepID=UPI000A174449|nr:DsbA family oxidoreductase [Planktotalea arctica]